MTRHTLGPWRARKPNSPYALGNWIVEHADLLIARLFGPNDAENEANARLVAASPDMLAALEGIRKALHSPNNSLRDRAEAWDNLDAAIAKARGEDVR